MSESAEAGEHALQMQMILVYILILDSDEFAVGAFMCGELAIHELTPAERLLVVSFRFWALPHAQPDGLHPDWRAAFRSAGLGNVECELFEALLAILFSASRRPIEVHRAACVGVSRDEEEFLWCIGLHQSERTDEAAEILSKWLRPAAVGVSASLMSNLAESLRVAGIVLFKHQFEHVPSRKFTMHIVKGSRSVH